MIFHRKWPILLHSSWNIIIVGHRYEYIGCIERVKSIEESIGEAGMGGFLFFYLMLSIRIPIKCTGKE